jgi:TrmH family RNA methyltransferase
MPVKLGFHADRLAGVRALQTPKGRRERNAFAFEGPTLLAEAHRSGITIEELYVTQSAYDASRLVGELDAAGTPTYVVDDRSAAKISDLETPTGIVAVARPQLSPLTRLLERDGVVLVLADLNDPGNAGALIRSAEAFGANGVAFGSLGVDPFHPKVVRSAMGSLFRVPLAAVDPVDLQKAAPGAGFEAIGLAAGGDPVGSASWPGRCLLIVGHERHGLGRWEGLCAGRRGIPMRPGAESLNAAVAGSIALFDALGRACQDSVRRPKSQDYPR